MCYLVREEGVVGPTVAFTGDVLFVGGCGRWVVAPGPAGIPCCSLSCRVAGRKLTHAGLRQRKTKCRF